MPAVPVQSLWSATAPPGPSTHPIASPTQAHVVVVGAGYTGLSAALHLAEAGRDVVVLESAEIGEGASGLNGGQVIAGVKHDPAVLEQLFEPALAVRLIATVGGAPQALYELVRRLQIDCALTTSGWIQPASSPAALSVLRQRAADWAARGAPVRVLDAEAVERLTGSRIYCGGLFDARGGTVQPLAYARGLARAALRAGARIFARSPALRLEHAGSGYAVTTPGGAVRAEQVIVATNAYSGRLVPALRRSVVAVPSFQVASAPLSVELRRRILPGGQGASDTRRLLRYFRLDASGRFVLGTRGTYAKSPSLHAVQRHYRAVGEIFPELSGIGFDYHWGGLVAMTLDHLPHLHQLAPGLLAGLGYNGRGVAMATAMGRELALRALGAPAAELGFPVTAVKPVPLHAFSSVGVRATIQLLRLADAWTRRRVA
ncbi:MAG: FAD-binding oxidoreductase [Gammaproteobacteria bacterium]|nr:FAD-binding oxidoreductase [Gammaproteobacteria bacterium]